MDKGRWTDKDYVDYYNRNYASTEEEFKFFAERLELGTNDRLIDFGCGNGDFLAICAPLAKSVTGVDLPGPQADIASERLAQFSNAEIIASPFTEVDLGERVFTKGFSRKALHHLTDPEKLAFIKNISANFALGALFWLEDGIFYDIGGINATVEDIKAHLPELEKEAAAYYGDSWELKRGDILRSFLEEFPATADYWEHCFRNAGFELIGKYPRCSFFGGMMFRRV
ncbi:MAG: class I SAM-dependent methyltransferase [bacterium]|nr:class I SAM-dependent methyltransferase [bacterium]